LHKHFSIEAVVTKTKPAHHKGSAPVEEFAKEKNLPTHYANSMSELDNVVGTNQFSSPLGIIIDYGVIVSQQTIDYFPLGIVNSHFSLLPEWRGADPITFSLLSGQKKTGVSLMIIEPDLDTGKLIAQRSLAIRPADTIQTLTDSLIQLSNQLLLEFIPPYLSSDLKPRNQSHPDRATYSRKLTKADGIIDWQKPAEQIEREIRAFLGWPASRTQLANKDVIITSVRVLTDLGESGKAVVKDKNLVIFCGKNALIIDSLKPAGKKEMSGAAFVVGHKDLLI